ncbi:MAG TPA: hypothetical protein VJ508_01180, partial [Saprospiraceae bacterium]|nr:hypothetical protein [Saprospiraceae bacterium]
TVSIVVDNPIVCINGSANLTSTVSNGSGIFNYQWQVSLNGGSSWSNVASNGTSSTYTAPTDVAGTFVYRLIVTDLGSGCADPVSNAVTVIVDNQPTVSISVNNPIICIGGSATVSSTITNGSGNYLYQWQSSPDGSSGWANITSGGNGANYNAPSSVAGTTYYRLLLTDVSNGCNDPMSNVVSVTVQNQPSVSVVADNPIVCIGGSVTISSTITNGSGNYLYQWQSSPNGSAWSNISSGGNGANYNPPTSSTGTTYYRVLVTDVSNGCNDPVSNAVTVTVDNQPSVSVAVDNNPVCIGGISTITSTITNGSGLYNYQWQSSPDGSGSWTNITVNGNSANYTTVASLPGTTYYRVLVTDLANGCNDPVSNVISITVDNQPTVSISVDNDIVCVGGSSTITSTITNGSGLYNYQWQSSPNGSSGWANITTNGNSANYNVPTSVPATTYYRLLVTDLANGCNDPMSNTVNVVVDAQPTVTISADHDIVCIGGSVTITSVIQNGSGFYTYQWQVSPDGSSGWANISSGGTGSTYNAPTSAPGTNYYRVMVTDVANNCNDPVSAAIPITVQDQPTVDIFAPDPVVCVGGTSIITSSVNNGSGFYLYQWQSSPNGTGSWTNIASGGNGPTYNVPTSSPNTTYYRVLVSDISNGCNDPISNVVNVTVVTAPTVSVNVDNADVCVGGSSTITSTVSNGSGFYLYQWQTSPNGSSGWTNVNSGGNGANYNVPTGIPGTYYYRVLVQDLANGCADPVSNVVSVVIHNQPEVSINVDNAVVCLGGTSTVTSTITNGSGLYNYQWQSSPDGSSWSNITVNGNNANYTTVATSTGTTYYRVLVTDLANGCSDPVSNIITITVEDQPSVNISIDHDVLCIGGSATISSVVSNGSGIYTYQWQSSPNGSSGWANITSGGNGAQYLPPTSSPGTTYYRVLVTDPANGCTDPMSNVVSLTIQPQPTVSVNVDNPIVCVGGSSTITSTVTNGSGFFLYQWQTSPDGTNGWTNITSGGFSATYSVPTGAPGSAYYRVLVTDVSNNCNDPVSNAVQVTVQDQATVSVAATNDIVCIGGSSVINSTIVGGSGNFLYQWQSSPNGSSGWANITTGGNGASYNAPTSVAGTTYYRLLLTDVSNGCGDPMSNVVSVTVNPQVNVSVSVDNAVVCIGGSSTITSVVTNGSGFFNYQWQSSPNGSSGWVNISVNGNFP